MKRCSRRFALYRPVSRGGVLADNRGCRSTRTTNAYEFPHRRRYPAFRTARADPARSTRRGRAVREAGLENPSLYRQVRRRLLLLLIHCTKNSQALARLRGQSTENIRNDGRPAANEESIKVKGLKERGNIRAKGKEMKNLLCIARNFAVAAAMIAGFCYGISWLGDHGFMAYAYGPAPHAVASMYASGANTAAR
jgi:hypothetical protein